MASMDTGYSGLEILPVNLKRRFANIAGQDDARPDNVQSTHVTTAGAIFITDGFDDNFDCGLLQPVEPNDVIVAAAVPSITAHNNLSFAHRCSPLRLTAVDNSVFSDGWSSGCSAFYALVRGDRVAVVNLRPPICLPGRQRKSPDHLQIQIDETWQDFDAWLATLPVPHPLSCSADEAYEEQWQWWQENGQQFQLVQLPADLLPTMLLHLMGEVVYSGLSNVDTYDYMRYTRTAKGLFGFQGKRYRGRLQTLRDRTADWTQPLDIPPVNESVMVLNKSIAKVAREVLVKDTVKVVDAQSGLRCLGATVPPQDYLHNLRRLQLNFSHREYFDFFGVKVAPFGTNLYYHPTADCLRQLPTLRSLELRFMSNMSQASSPWHRMNI